MNIEAPDIIKMIIGYRKHNVRVILFCIKGHLEYARMIKSCVKQELGVQHKDDFLVDTYISGNSCPHFDVSIAIHPGLASNDDWLMVSDINIMLGSLGRS